MLLVANACHPDMPDDQRWKILMAATIGHPTWQHWLNDPQRQRRAAAVDAMRLLDEMEEPFRDRPRVAPTRPFLALLVIVFSVALLVVVAVSRS